MPYCYGAFYKNVISLYVTTYGLAKYADNYSRIAFYYHIVII